MDCGALSVKEIISESVMTRRGIMGLGYILARFLLQIRYEETEAELEEEVDILMSSDIVAVQMSTKAITLDRAQSGWLFRKDRSELIGAFRVSYGAKGQFGDRFMGFFSLYALVEIVAQLFYQMQP